MSSASEETGTEQAAFDGVADQSALEAPDLIPHPTTQTTPPVAEIITHSTTPLAQVVMSPQNLVSVQQAASPVPVAVPLVTIDSPRGGGGSAPALEAPNLIPLSAIATPANLPAIVQVQSVVHRSPPEPVALARRMVYKVKFHAHLEDGRLILLEDVGFEANPMESGDVFVDAISTLEVCKRIMTALSITSFRSEGVTMKVAFNEPGHGFKGRKQYLVHPSDWKAMYTLFNSLRKRTTIYMTFDVRRKLKGISTSSASSLPQLPVSSKPAVVRSAEKSAVSINNQDDMASKQQLQLAPQLPSLQQQQQQQQQQSTQQTPTVQVTPTSNYYSNGEPMNKRSLSFSEVQRVSVGVDSSTPQTAEMCPNCQSNPLKRMELRCNLRERLLAQLKVLSELSGGKVADVDEEVLRRVQQDTIDDISLLCSQP